MLRCLSLFGFRLLKATFTLRRFKRSDEVNLPHAKTFVCDKNTRIPQMRCGPEGRLGGSPISFRNFKISILTVPSTSEQSPLCSGVFLCLWQKRRHPPAPLLLLSNCDPLRWARSWWAALRAAFLGNGKRSILTAPSKDRRKLCAFGGLGPGSFDTFAGQIPPAPALKAAVTLLRIRRAFWHC